MSDTVRLTKEADPATLTPDFLGTYLWEKTRITREFTGVVHLYEVRFGAERDSPLGGTFFQPLASPSIIPLPSDMQFFKLICSPAVKSERDENLMKTYPNSLRVVEHRRNDFLSRPVRLFSVIPAAQKQAFLTRCRPAVQP